MIVQRCSRGEITGYPNHHQVSDLGFVQFGNDYDPALLALIAEKALQIKRRHSRKRQLNLNYIRDAASFIPEINEIVDSRGRQARLDELAGTRLEPYPISVISSILTFTGATPRDGSITWHADGVPVTELIPVSIVDPAGGELEVYRGASDEGLARVHAGGVISEKEVIRVEHRVGRSVLAQLMRIMHRVRPMTSGSRVTLNLNYRSIERPFVDDDSMCYLAADNPDFSWQQQYIRDVRDRQLPAYLDHVNAGR